MFVKKLALTLALILAFSAAVVAGAQFTGFGRANAVQVETVQSSDPNRQFDVDIVYAYFQDGSYVNVVFNVTHVSDLPISSEGLIEVFETQMYATDSQIGDKVIGWQIGEGLSMEEMMSLTMSLHSFCVTRRYGLMTVSIMFEPFDPVLTEPIYLSLKRIGWITINGSIQSDLLGDEFVKEVKLENFGDGFLYNVLVPTEQLPNIDLYTPWESSNPNSPSLSPSPSPEPIAKPEPQDTAEVPSPAIWVAAVVLVAAVFGVGLGLQIYLLKQ
jgi:hypothetical protein